MDHNVDENILQSLESYSGPLVRELALSRPKTFAFLKNPDAKLRFAALALIDIKWGLTQEVADLCEKLAREDPDVKVRGMAVVCIWAYYTKQNNLRIGQLLAKIVLDQGESIEVRVVAYRGLLYMREIYPHNWSSPVDFRFPEDVDWSFVDSFL